MEMKKEISIGIIILALLLIGFGYYVYRDKGRVGNPIENTATTTNSNDISTLPAIETTSGSAGYTIEQVPVQNLPPAPSLSRPIVYPASFTDAQRSILEKNINGNIALIKKNPKDVDAWVSLGNNRKIVTDYVGAIEAWDYASILAPKYVVPVRNTADTYHFYLKNYPKSEIYWKKAIILEPQNPDLYKGLFDLYSLSYKEKASLSEQTLIDGIKKSLQKIDLMVYLAEYYKNTGRKDDARTKYKEAISLLLKEGNTVRVEALEEELNNL
jgi:tetratricopeptide (TPR) repeat protein